MVSLSFKTGWYSPPKLKGFIGRVLHDHSDLVEVCKGGAQFLSSDVCRVCSASEVELKYLTFIETVMKFDTT